MTRMGVVVEFVIELISFSQKAKVRGQFRKCGLGERVGHVLDSALAAVAVGLESQARE